MSEQASQTPACAALISEALEFLEAWADGHDAAMFHVNVLSIDDPRGVVSGFRGGSLSSLDRAASARGVPFRAPASMFHQAVLAVLSAAVDAGEPLYLLRVRFERGDEGWHSTGTTTQSTAERTQLLSERSPLDERLGALLSTALDEEGSEMTLRWGPPPTGGAPGINAGIVMDDGIFRLVEPPPTIADLLLEIEAFYRERDFVLDSLSATVERAHDLAPSVKDYYG
jgi:hypothetical protein